MKTLKVSLAVIVIAAITFFIIRSSVPTGEVGEVGSGENIFIVKINEDIQELIQKPNDKFCKDYYDEIALYIDDYHKNGKLAKDKSENDQWKANLSQNLYSAYADKFIKQAFYVFNHKEWKPEDLNFIRSEYQTLRNSPRLEKDSPVDKEFAKIRAIFSKYDEIAGFIASCKGFSYTGSDLSARYPISEANNFISRAAAYRNNRLGNAYVNNCVRLHYELTEIPQNLFKAHVHYLDNKISYWSDLYSNYNSQKAYADNLYTPLRNEIYALDNDSYNVANFDSEYRRLTAKWETDGTKAYNYFNN